MNINLDRGADSDDSIQSDIDEHIEIMRTAGLDVGRPVMLMQDPEYPSAYRVWTRLLPPVGTLESAQAAQWVWVEPGGEVLYSRWPWAVTA